MDSRTRYTYVKTAVQYNTCTYIYIHLYDVYIYPTRKHVDPVVNAESQLPKTTTLSNCVAHQSMNGSDNIIYNTVSKYFVFQKRVVDGLSKAAWSICFQDDFGLNPTSFQNSWTSRIVVLVQIPHYPTRPDCNQPPGSTPSTTPPDSESSRHLAKVPEFRSF